MLDLTGDDGYLDVSVTAPDGGRAAARLDLFRSWNTFCALVDRHPDPVEQGDAWADWLAEQGLAGLTHYDAFRVAGAIGDRVAELKKNTHPTTSAGAGSAGTTGSTVPGCPPDPSAT